MRHSGHVFLPRPVHSKMQLPQKRCEQARMWGATTSSWHTEQLKSDCMSASTASRVGAALRRGPEPAPASLPPSSALCSSRPLFKGNMVSAKAHNYVVMCISFTTHLFACGMLESP